MTARLTSLGRVLSFAVLSALGARVGAAAPASAAATSKPSQPTPPAADTVRAYDRPSDDGTTIIVEWAKPGRQVKDAFYVIEVARSPDGFRTGRFRTHVLIPSDGTLKAANPKYFGFREANKGIYFAEVSPADLFLRPQLTPGWIGELVAEKFITESQAARASALLGEKPPERQLTPEEQAEWGWLARLGAAAQAKRRLGELAERKLLADADLNRARQVYATFKPDEQLTDQEKADRKWLVGLWPLLKRKELLAKSLERGVISRQRFDRAMEALANTKGDAELTGAQRSDRKWLARLEAYLTASQQDADKDRRDEVNAAEYCIRLAASAGKGAGKVTVYALRDGEPVVLRASASTNLFKRFKLNNLIFAVAFSGIVLAFIQIARRNPNLFIRKIPGLEAIEEAIGRATEMGRSVYFVHGLHDVNALSTIAAINVLARVARRAAEYDTRVRVMNNLPIVTAVSQEVVQQAYTEAGRPDAYNADDVSLVATDQFSYVAAVSGMMVREQPAAIFYLGYFYAESLLLAETGASTGAIQIAGTDAYTQLPFFVTTCDYTLIGEELYAASAYLSREPRMLGSLRGQDVAKAFLMAAIVAGTIAMTITVAVGGDTGWILNLLEAF